MKKRSRRARLPDVPRQTSQPQTAAATGVKKLARRGRPKNPVKIPPSSVSCEGSVTLDQDAARGDGSALDTGPAVETEAHARPVNRSKPSGSGRLSTAFCRLCHGKFSPRSLRNAFDKRPGGSAPAPTPKQTETAAGQSRLLFHSDFQRLVGVPLDRDPELPQFVCKNCHTKFYKCHSILLTFLQRVNLPPTGRDGAAKDRKNLQSSAVDHSMMSPPVNSDPQCLLGLVSWAHHHGGACSSCPGLKEVLEGQCWGSVRAVWGCVDGHSYAMDTQTTEPRANARHARATGGDSVLEGEGQWREDETPVRSTSALARPSSGETPQTQSSMQTEATAINTDEFPGGEETPSPATPALVEDRTGDSDLSDRDVSSYEELEDRRRSGDDELFQPYPEKKAAHPKKRSRAAKSPQEGGPPAEVRKKPGPKPGWKKKFKPEREELPNIYKCPYQGCTAVYRGADGMKKHIKEHHEEVRERPCPHPGCNKIFMIDRYLQRHVKLIHTEVRNYICDQCGQTFKQRKHLSVHQMRHSGVKPLQCEVCGFQCRQRASLKYHMTKHKAEADLDFQCATCSKRFEKAHNLNVHMSMVHPLTQGGSNNNSSSTALLLPPDPSVQAITVTSQLLAQFSNS